MSFSRILLQTSGLFFRSWAQFWAVFDVTVVFGMLNCVFWQLKMSIGQKFGQHMSKVRKLGPNFGRRYVWATDRGRYLCPVFLEMLISMFLVFLLCFWSLLGSGRSGRLVAFTCPMFVKIALYDAEL